MPLGVGGSGINTFWDGTFVFSSFSFSFFLFEVFRSIRLAFVVNSGLVDCNILSRFVVSRPWVVVPRAAMVLAEASAGCDLALDRAGTDILRWTLRSLSFSLSA